MRPFDDMPIDPDADDYADVALLVASVREWPTEEFLRELDGRVARRFAPSPAPARRFLGRGSGRGRLPRWAAGVGGAASALVAAGVVAAVVIGSGGGLGGSSTPKPQVYGAIGLANHATAKQPASGAVRQSAGSAAGQALTTPSVNSGAAGLSATASAPTPVAPGARQIQSAQISLATANQHVDQVSQEVFDVVALEHGTVQSSHITAATASSGGGYAYFSLTIPTSNLQDAMTQLSRLRYATVSARTDASQNVSNQYGNDQRQLADAQALRTSLLKQLQTAYTQSAIDSIRAQLKLAEQQIAQWQSTLNALQHRIGSSDVSVQINSGGLPIVPVASSGGFTIHRAGHDAVRVLVVSAGVALIVLAVLVPVSLVVALLAWLWVWLRQRRRERALDAA